MNTNCNTCSLVVSDSVACVTAGSVQRMHQDLPIVSSQTAIGTLLFLETNQMPSHFSKIVFTQVYTVRIYVYTYISIYVRTCVHMYVCIRMDMFFQTAAANGCVGSFLVSQRLIVIGCRHFLIRCDVVFRRDLCAVQRRITCTYCAQATYRRWHRNGCLNVGRQKQPNAH